MLLSTILGPVKPPVATSDDVAAAGNMFKVGAAENDGTFRAVAVDGDEHITVAPTDSCLICLEEYTTDQVVRKLNKCVHMFHQECVDQVISHPFLKSCIFYTLLFPSYLEPADMLFIVAHHWSQLVPPVPWSGRGRKGQGDQRPEQSSLRNSWTPSYYVRHHIRSRRLRLGAAL
jgi:hypothetical protein